MMMGKWRSNEREDAILLRHLFSRFFFSFLFCLLFRGKFGSSLSTRGYFLPGLRKIRR